MKNKQNLLGIGSIGFRASSKLRGLSAALAVSAASLTVIAISAQAQVTRLAHYGLGEPGTTNTSAPYLVNDIPSGSNNYDFNGEGYQTVFTIGTAGVTAPGSTAYLNESQGANGASGFYMNDGSGATSFNLSTNWATQLWINPATAAGTLAFQTNGTGSITDGESVWFQNVGQDIAFGTGALGTDSPVVGPSYSLGTWYRIGIINYQGTMHYYVNGTEVGTGTSASGRGTLGLMELGWAGGENGTAASFDELNVYSFTNNDSLFDVTAALAAVPEPSTLVLAGLFGIGMLMLFRRRRA